MTNRACRRGLECDITDAIQRQLENERPWCYAQKITIIPCRAELHVGRGFWRNLDSMWTFKIENRYSELSSRNTAIQCQNKLCT